MALLRVISLCLLSLSCFGQAFSPGDRGWMEAVTEAPPGAAWNGGYLSECFTTNESPLSQGGMWLDGSVKSGAKGVAVTNWGNLGTIYYAIGVQPGTNNPPYYDDAFSMLTGSWGPTQAIDFTIFITNMPTQAHYWELEYGVMNVMGAYGRAGPLADISLASNDGYIELGIGWTNGSGGGGVGLCPSATGAGVIPTNGSIVHMAITNLNISIWLNGSLVINTQDWTYSTNYLPHGNPLIGFFDQGYTAPGFINTNFGMTCINATDYGSVWRSIFTNTPSTSGLSSNCTTIVWGTTNVIARPESNSVSAVDWGIAANTYTNSQSSNNMTTGGQIFITNLVPSTIYHYQARSQNTESGLWVTNGDNTFTTTAVGGGGGTCTVLLAQDTQSGSGTLSANFSQQFTLGASATICKARFYLDGTGTYKVQIRDASNGGGTQQGTDSQTVSVTSTPGFYDVTWSSNPSLSAGTYYLYPVTVTGGQNLYHNFVGSGGKAYDPNLHAAWDFTYELWTMQ